MVVNILDHQNSILANFLYELRDKNIQVDPLRFRKNIERIGEIIAYEISKKLEYTKCQVNTPLGVHNQMITTNSIVIGSILRAGLPLHNGLLNFYDKAENAFISAYRKPINETDFSIEIDYFAAPDLTNKTLILADPMLATGRSLVGVHNAIKKFGQPKEIHIASVIGSKPGVEFIKSHFPDNTTLWIGSVDNELNKKGYIIPGLGDAGDLSFGQKK